MTTVLTFRLLTCWLVSAGLLHPGALRAQPVAVVTRRVRPTDFCYYAAWKARFWPGDLTQVVQGDRLVSNLIFRFKDGSVDDETAVFSQRHNFKFLSNHQVQKGPSFPDPIDVSL